LHKNYFERRFFELWRRSAGEIVRDGTRTGIHSAKSEKNRRGQKKAALSERGF
jgi:hypothetical protein